MLNRTIFLHPTGCGHLILYDADKEGAMAKMKAEITPIAACCLCSYPEHPEQPAHAWSGCAVGKHEK